jgi:hypothetical protein
MGMRYAGSERGQQNSLPFVRLNFYSIRQIMNQSHI